MNRPETVVRIDLEALKRNYHRLCDKAGEHCELAAVVKAEAYGHGILKVSETLFQEGCRTFCIISLEEGEGLRKSLGEQARILRLIPSLPCEYEIVQDLGLEEMLVSLKQAQEWGEYLKKNDKTLPVHVKVDCGMGRLGALPEEVEELLQYLVSKPCLQVKGFLSHLPACSEPRPGSLSRDHRHTLHEIELFRHQASHAEAIVGQPMIKHLASSGGLLYYPESRFDMVRIGLALYGADPAGESAQQLGLEPVLRFESYLAQVRRLQPGMTIGYGRTYPVSRPMRVGVVPAGYADGWFRASAGTGAVLIGGQRCPILGRISMNLISVELPDEIHLQEGDRVTLIGRDGGDCITAEEVAGWFGTIPYEVLTSIGGLNQRLY